MYLEKLEFSRFRSCHDTHVWFKRDLTVLVGENNGGKSNVVDAIRLLTTPADGRRSRYCEPGDLRYNSADESFTLRAVYAGLSVGEQALSLPASEGVDSERIAHRLRFDLPNPGHRRGKVTWTVGANDALDPEPAARDRIRHVYLPPLRDAQQELSSGSGNRIEFVLRSLANGEELGNFEVSAGDAFDGLTKHPVIQRADKAVADQLASITAGTVPHRSRIGFVEPSLRYLARALRMKLGEWDVDPIELAHSGLGYANLLFLATVVVELSGTKDADLTIFLVEEPEAHLHPQLQGAVLDFLIEASRRDENVPGSVQVVVTTHSAQLAAAVPSAHVEVIKNTPTDDVVDTAERHTRQSKAVPIWLLDVNDDQRRKVDRYLDATRSAMLFGPRVLLVEGIAEVLLLPSIARRVLVDPREFALFRSASLVGIGGVDFEPYVRILLTAHDGVRVAERVVVVTDSDPAAPGDRVANLQALGTELGATDVLTVTAAPITLEASLVQAGNLDCLKDAFIAQRPGSQRVWEELLGQPPDDLPAALVAMYKEKRILKGDLAQFVAGFIDEPNNEFVTPRYLEDAIRAIAVA